MDCSAGFSTVDSINCLFVRLRQEFGVHVDPRYSEHLIVRSQNKSLRASWLSDLPPRVVPPMKALSHTTSIILSTSPTTTPLAHRGTPPESWTLTTRSPNLNCWPCKREVTCAGLITARRGIRCTLAFLIASVDRLAVRDVARASISAMVS
jgi:hypothetical protein